MNRSKVRIISLATLVASISACGVKVVPADADDMPPELAHKTCVWLRDAAETMGMTNAQMMLQAEMAARDMVLTTKSIDSILETC